MKLTPRRMTFIAVVVALALLLPNTVQARSYSFLREAIHEYADNPNPETEAALDHARFMAKALDYSIVGLPIIVIAIAIGIRRLRHRQCSRDNR